MSRSFRLEIHTRVSKESDIRKVDMKLRDVGVILSASSNWVEMPPNSYEKAWRVCFEGLITLSGGETPSEAHQRIRKALDIPIESKWWDDDQPPNYEFSDEELANSEDQSE